MGPWLFSEKVSSLSLEAFQQRETLSDTYNVTRVNLANPKNADDAT